MDDFDDDDLDFLPLLLEEDFCFGFGSPSSSKFSSSSSRGDGMRLNRIFGNGLTSIVTGSEEELLNASSTGPDLVLVLRDL